jgi:hypothetical protein
MKTISTVIKKVGKMNLVDPQYGDMKLSVMPFENDGTRIFLPRGFEMWDDILNQIMKTVPYCEGANRHYVTIDSRFFSKADFLRREGIHADGNFCVDPNFVHATWGGTVIEPKETWGGATVVPEPKETWGGAKYHAKYKVVKDWELPYDIEIPLGDYISDKKGGLFCIATEVGCQGWSGEFFGEVGPEGDCTNMSGQFTDNRKTLFEKDTLYFMTSNTPHETLFIDKGKRRTLLRITLNHEYPNELLPCMQDELVSINK